MRPAVAGLGRRSPGHRVTGVLEVAEPPAGLVKVGSVNESDAEAGICHVIEHMLFKGTPARPAGTIARDVEAASALLEAEELREAELTETDGTEEANR